MALIILRVVVGVSLAVSGLVTAMVGAANTEGAGMTTKAVVFVLTLVGFNLMSKPDRG